MRQLGAIVLVTACSSGSGSVALSDLGGRIATSACEKIFQCCTQAQISAEFQGATITDEASCQLFIAGLYLQYSLPEYDASIAAGRVAYDGDDVDACLSHVDGLSCTEFSMDTSIDDFVSIPGCQAFFTPKVELAGACTQDYECTTNNCVGATTSSTGSTDGACMPLPTEGETCVVNCAAGLYCAVDATTDAVLCAAQKAAGVGCSGNDECASGTCLSDMTCAAPGSVCNGM